VRDDPKLAALLAAEANRLEPSAAAKGAAAAALRALGVAAVPSDGDVIAAARAAAGREFTEAERTEFGIE
jgi:hypothetical protein